MIFFRFLMNGSPPPAVLHIQEHLLILSLISHYQSSSCGLLLLDSKYMHLTTTLGRENWSNYALNMITLNYTQPHILVCLYSIELQFVRCIALRQKKCCERKVSSCRLQFSYHMLIICSPPQNTQNHFLLAGEFLRSRYSVGFSEILCTQRLFHKAQPLYLKPEACIEALQIYSQCLKTYFNVILLPVPVYLKWLLPLGLLDANNCCILVSFPMHQTFFLFHSLSRVYPKNIC